MQVVVVPQASPAGVSGVIDGFMYWYEGLAQWVNLNPAAPPTIAQGKSVFMLVWWRNTGSVSWVGHVDLSITKPNGSKVTPAATENQNKSAIPGNGWGVVFSGTVLDIVGTYRCEAVLSAVT